jgi:hypothetical protein
VAACARVQVLDDLASEDFRVGLQQVEGSEVL